MCLVIDLRLNLSEVSDSKGNKPFKPQQSDVTEKGGATQDLSFTLRD